MFKCGDILFKPGRITTGLLIAWPLVVLAAEPEARNAKPETQNHWAFKPPTRPLTPGIKSKGWPRNTIDHFILSRLEKDGLSPSPEANPRTLIRRLSFGLTGLPPSPQEVEEFVADNSPGAYASLVERLLASPHYGERWGRHWLDAAGYSDSNGYFDADTDRPLAYKYRDYVIRSFNDDKPFDRFIREQIAGDELIGYRPGGDVTPEMVDLLIATHFLRNGPDGTGESDGNPQEQRVDRFSVLEGNVQIIGSALLGLTVQCARCHDHKFEPVSQEEYYQLQAILRPAYDPDKWIKPNDRALTIGTKAQREQNKREIEKFEKESKALKQSLDGLMQPWRKLVLDENLARLPEEEREAVQKALDTKEKERSAKMKELLKTHEALVQIKDEDLVKRFPEVASSYNSLVEGIKGKDARRPIPLPQIAALTEPTNKPPLHHVLVRGNYTKAGREVEPAVPPILCSGKDIFQVTGQSTGSSGRRTALATWLTSAEHPMAARLMVNRIWQHHFGLGIVATPDNFGVTGSRPSHPELLDWLTTEFIRTGWSVKALHRLMVMSATYRQASLSRGPAKASQVDPENRLLWRFPLQRLDGESMRDAMLAISGELERKAGGPYVPKAKTDEGQYVIREEEPGSKRRAIYLQQRRTSPVTFLDLFDGAKMNPNCLQRTASTVPLQSLALLNSDFVRARSKGVARRLLNEAKDDPNKRINFAFELTFGRAATAEERTAAGEFLKSQAAHYSGRSDADLLVLTDFCQMLFAGNSFLYVE